MMRFLNKPAIFIALILLVNCSIQVLAQPEKGKVFFPIVETEAGYTGGIEWIINRSSKTDFILFGEQHGIEEIPRFVSAVFMKTRNQGFTNLIIESDPLTMERIEESGVSEFTKAYPHSLAFDYDGEIELLNQVLQSKNITKVLWGVDQIVTAIHTFEILEKEAQTSASRRLCRGLFLKSALKAGEYLREDNFKDLELLKKNFEKEDNNRAIGIVDELISSMTIYTNHRAARRGEISPDVSVTQRENLMKKNFDNFIAETKGEEKAIVKMGGSHTTYGIGPNNIVTLGEHINLYAKNNNKRILSIGVFGYPSSNSFVPDSILKVGEGVLIDCQALKLPENAAFTAGLPASFVPNLNYFDAVVYFYNAKKATKTTLYPLENAFKKRIISILLAGVIPAVIGVMALFCIPVFFLRKNWYDLRVPYLYLFLFSGILSLVLISEITSIVAGFPSQNAALLPSATSLIFYSVFGLLLLAIFVSVRFHFKKLKNRSQRFIILGLSINTLFLLVYMYYWNLGGMFN